MIRWLRPLLIVAALTGAFCVTFVWPRQNGLDFDIDTSPRAQAAKKRIPYDLSQVRVLKTVVAKVNQNYVEPQRIQYRTMLLAGLNAIQRAVAPVIVHHDNGQATFKIQVNNDTAEFRADDVNSPWALTWRFQEVFKFLQDKLSTDEDIKLREVEYAAINGMLRTLDPHSVLLEPEEFSEMQLSTKGEFGGLGIVISIREGQLTVIKPMEGTPAFMAGLKRGDRITNINDESTLNMPLEEAVSRLRGAPGSSVTVWVIREGNKGWTKPKRFDLVRAVIHIESIESRQLEGGIGLVRLKSFQSNTCDDLQQALQRLHQQNLKGLVLDLRDNPGGLLQQAVCVADVFLSRGTIVTTSSNDPEKSERKLAHAEGTEPDYPLVVLANGGSASASEIVAGALKNHDRALVVGERTFGKGSVQVLYNDDSDGWALKLTIAQYLTPGDVSIQSVGIVPDVEIEPMTVDPVDMDLTVNTDYLREADLHAHLTHDQARDSQKPEVVLRYYLPEDTRQRLREASPDDVEENEKESEFLIQFSRSLLARATRSGRRELLREAQPVIEEARARELQHAVVDLKKLGVDWQTGKDEGPSEVSVEASTDRPENVAKAGEPFELRLKVTNKGKAPLYQLRAVTKSDNRLFSDRELVFGKLSPGETRTWSTTLGICKSDSSGKRECSLPKNLSDRADGIRINFQEAFNHAPPPAEVRVRVQSLAVPQFAYTVHVADNGRGNGDGDIERGELVTVYLRVKNVGTGTSEETVANLRNLSGPGLLLHAGRFQIGEMKPGSEQTVAFTFEVLPEFAESAAKLEVSAGDSVLRESVGEKLQLPVRQEPPTDFSTTTGSVALGEEGLVYERPSADARVVARARGGMVELNSQATVGNFVRVDLGDGRPGWVKRAQLAQKPGATKGKLVDVLAHMPPKLEVNYGNALVTQQDSLKVKGSAVDDTRVRDVYIFVGSRKVFYQSNRNANDPTTQKFDVALPLRPGINFVTVVARESNDVASHKSFIVRRDGPNGALLDTPKNDDEDDMFHAQSDGSGEP
ncbi:MAG TPA: MXAN_5808 family serine peptidase [Polyangiales bacterium]|nr:MXAN_5808 family serine peptidase [Polyangiales bacterium]